MASAGVLVILALPAFGMHTAFPGISSLPREIPIMKTYDRIQASFPGGPLPAVVAVEGDSVASPEFAAPTSAGRRSRPARWRTRSRSR